ncbi:hypothetical protein CEXT_695661 [Caerostris extrusa]|uniref:Uncharacterized protein n=1 Tax=Caerostris extrusa TaxID=172846 RepID=A0AAV4P1F7_CAEEX|nr:hypothetical protein CEXT_695661 [Caerostris extrusa]
MLSRIFASDRSEFIQSIVENTFCSPKKKSKHVIILRLFSTSWYVKSINNFSKTYRLQLPRKRTLCRERERRECVARLLCDLCRRDPRKKQYSQSHYLEPAAAAEGSRPLESFVGFLALLKTGADNKWQSRNELQLRVVINHCQC